MTARKTVKAPAVAETAGIGVTRLVGYVGENGIPFAQESGRTDNIFEGPVPMDRAVELLSFPVETVVPTVTVNGETFPFTVKGKGFKGFYRTDIGVGIGIGSEGKAEHPYPEWLLGGLSNLLDSDVNLGSVGLLRQGAQAWATIETDDNREGPGGIVYKPRIMAFSSYDGSLSTGFGKCHTLAVCANTFSMGLSEMGADKWSVKHTKNSALRIADARQALSILVAQADEFDAAMELWLNTPVTDTQFTAWLDAVKPLPAPETDRKSGGPGRAYTMAEGYRDRVTGLYRTDPRVAPWQGTKFGVFQAFNTDATWNTQVKGESQDRTDRNIGLVIHGASGEADANAMVALDRVLATV